MILVKVLKRKDASSVVVAVATALILFSFVAGITADLTSRIVTSSPRVYGDWKMEYLSPLVAAVLELLALEILCWIWAWGASSMKKK